jgi:hypothetical protein
MRSKARRGARNEKIAIGKIGRRGSYGTDHDFLGCSSGLLLRSFGLLQSDVDIIEQDVEVGKIASFGMCPDGPDKVMKALARCFIDLPQFIQSLYQRAADHQREKGNVVGLIFGLHRTLQRN